MGPEKGGVPPSLSARYSAEGLTWRSANDPGKIVVVDRGARMHTFVPDSSAVVSAMAMAAGSRGWKSLEVTGTDTFRRTAYVEATARGASVGGYEPTSADRKAATRGAELIASLRNPMVQAYLLAKSPTERAAANAAYPGLDKAFAAEDVARRAVGAQTRSSPATSDAFMARFRENAAIALDKGRELPKIQPTTRSSEVGR
jgi:hypothetical protein